MGRSKVRSEGRGEGHVEGCDEGRSEGCSEGHGEGCSEGCLTNCCDLHRNLCHGFHHSLCSGPIAAAAAACPSLPRLNAIFYVLHKCMYIYGTLCKFKCEKAMVGLLAGGA